MLFEHCKYVYFNIHDSNIATAEFLVISAETGCWEIEKENSQIFNEDFYLPLGLPLWERVLLERDTLLLCKSGQKSRK
jgi:hypothetical protein